MKEFDESKEDWMEKSERCDRERKENSVQKSMYEEEIKKLQNRIREVSFDLTENLKRKENETSRNLEIQSETENRINGMQKEIKDLSIMNKSFKSDLEKERLKNREYMNDIEGYKEKFNRLEESLKKSLNENNSLMEKDLEGQKKLEVTSIENKELLKKIENLKEKFMTEKKEYEFNLLSLEEV